MDEATCGRSGSGSAPSRQQPSEINGQFELACGLQSEQQIELALAWFKKLALLGHVESAYRAGFICLSFESTKCEAFYWMQLAAQRGYACAEYELALLYERGWGVEMNPDLALQYLRLAAQHGDPDAQHKLDRQNAFLDQVVPDVGTSRRPKVS